MEKKEKHLIDVILNNVAVPEVIVDKKPEDALGVSDAEIDYGGAVPEVHIKKNNGRSSE